MPAPSTIDLQEFARSLGQEIAAALQPAYEDPEVADEEATEPAPVDATEAVDATVPDLQERFLPLLAAILPAVVATVPSIINDIRRRHQALGPVPDDPQVAHADFQAVLAEIVPHLVACLPDLLATLERESPDLTPDDPESSTRFLGALLSGPLVPSLLSAVPNVISALAGSTRELSAATYDDPETASRFLGNILGSVLGAVSQPVGGLLSGAGAAAGVTGEEPAPVPLPRPEARPHRTARPAGSVRR